MSGPVDRGPALRARAGRAAGAWTAGACALAVGLLGALRPAHADDADPRRQPTPEIPPHLRVPEAKAERHVASLLGRVPPAVVVTTVDHHDRTVPAPGRPMVIFYEDKDAGTQNVAIEDRLGHLDDHPENRRRFEVLPVADVEKFNFWPARRFAARAIHHEEKKAGSTIYIDWTGAVRKKWGLTRGRSGVLLLDPAGVLVFAEEGPLSPARSAELCALLASFGLTIPQ